MRPNPCVKAIAVLVALTFGGLAPAIPPPTAAADDATTAATAATAAAAAATPTETAITVLGVTDLHGHIERTTDPATGAVADPGAVTLACEISRVRESSPGAVLVSSGDNLGDSPPASALLEDQPALDVLNAMSTDVSALGAHEFDKGLDDLTDRILPSAAFPYLSANLTGSALDSEGEGGGTFIKDVNGVKVGFVGIMTDDFPALVAPATAGALSPAPAAATANAKAAELKRTGAADVVVVLAHADADGLAPRLTGDVDAVLGGYSDVGHPGAGESATMTSIDGQDIAVVQADRYGRGLAEVSLAYSASTREVSVISAADRDLRTSDCTADAYGVEGIVSQASARAAAGDSQRAATLGTDFLRGSSDGVTPGTSLGTESTASDLIADSYAHWASANAPRGDAARIIGLASPGDAHADLLYAKDPANGETVDGALTKGEAQAFEPLGNEMSYAVLTGARLKAVLAQQWRPGDDRGVLTLGTSANLSVRIDQDAADELYAIHDEVAKGTATAAAKATPIADARSRVIASIVIDGVPLADDDSVLVASSSPLMAGGDGYAALSEVSAVATDSVDRDVLTEYLEYLNSFGGRGVSASYLKHQTGLASTISQANPRAATLNLTGLVHSNDSEKPRGVTSVRYSYQEASGVTVTSEAVAVDSTTVANRPETGRATLQVVFGQDAAAQKCSFGDAQDTSCFLATIELLDASGAVLSTYGYELAIDGSAAKGIDSETGAGGTGASMRAEEVVVAPTPVGRSDHGAGMARTGATIGIGVIALGLLIGGAILLVRRRGGADEGDAVDAEDADFADLDGPAGTGSP
ncbi:5'-nucleotidase C-terminal domain-containing protein [Actinomyces massiliensis]|uniref:bifunctional metallophosphatase/5'-nucleotidase n=1 Tax=Actinomyces massiliensis TaxID=461393 RepID=UPI001E457A0E|nr:5'-nucleotidase C-terminal domain-containing protein [Actinomyces massiliensis]WLD72056.1 5'-nucleotidase C-terminal domain-containing protein [Actinomyces massiliensis]